MYEKKLAKSPLQTQYIVSEVLNMELPLGEEINLSDSELDDSLIKLILDGLQDNIEGSFNV